MWVRVLRTKVQVGAIFRDKYFYRHLLAINSNVDFIINSIDFQHNKVKSQLKTVMWTIKQIHGEFSYKYFIGAASNSIADFIISSIAFQYK